MEWAGQGPSLLFLTQTAEGAEKCARGAHRRSRGTAVLQTPLSAAERHCGGRSSEGGSVFLVQGCADEFIKEKAKPILMGLFLFIDPHN